MEILNEQSNINTKKVKKTKKSKTNDEPVISENVVEENAVVEKTIVENKNEEPIDVSEKINITQETIIENPSSDEVDDDNNDTENKIFEEISLETFKSKVEAATKLNNELISDFKNIEMSPDFIKTIDKHLNQLDKSHDNLKTAIKDSTNKAYIQSSKNTKKKKAVLTSEEKKNKKPSDVSKLKETFPFVRQFLKIGDDTLASKADMLRAIPAYVKSEKAKKNPDIDVIITVKEQKKAKGDKSPPVFIELPEPTIDNQQFKIIGDLVPLFEGIKKEMIARNKSVENFPTTLKYKGIMTYLAYCFPPTTKAK